jgi:hypothetical protein
MEAGEDVLRVVDKETGVSYGCDAVDDVENSRNHQQDPYEQSTSHTSHLLPPWSTGAISHQSRHRIV